MYNIQAKEMKKLSTAEKKEQMLYLILNQIIKTGFKDLKMDDFINMLPASRSTVYRYFKSRQEIIAGVVDEYLKYLDQFKIPTSLPQKDDDWIRNIERQLEEALILNSHLSAIFLKDLQTEFPDEYQRLQDKINSNDEQLVQFCKAGQEKGYYNSSEPALWILQDRLMIPRLIDADYLVHHNLTIKKAINSYVDMKSQQIIKPKYLAKFDPSFTAYVVKKMDQKICFDEK